MINEMDGYSQEGPPSEEQVRQMRHLTGIDWTAEELWQHCFEYTSRASLEETAYLMFHKEYPPVYEADLAFWKCRPDISLDERAVYETYRFGRGALKTLEPLPLEKNRENLFGLGAGLCRGTGWKKLALSLFRAGGRLGEYAFLDF
ncbi:hypothetical protein [uncultured Oscillibacter sp.]|uniref:hypothetical protein n=1 Tax=uncultured Oscillibacter sp. TaxID=876091 RepID=UPI0026162B97|nr:hypothetical protein [uncultured Oscillibacter sp.]